MSSEYNLNTTDFCHLPHQLPGFYHLHHQHPGLSHQHLSVDHCDSLLVSLPLLPRLCAPNSSHSQSVSQIMSFLCSKHSNHFHLIQSKSGSLQKDLQGHIKQIFSVNKYLLSEHVCIMNMYACMHKGPFKNSSITSGDAFSVFSSLQG